MLAVRRLRAPRSLLVVLALAVTAPVLTVPGVAAADDHVAAGDTVVGQLVQAWPEYKDRDEAADRGADGPLSFVRTKTGDSVRVDTDDVEDLPLGATVELTVGRAITDAAAAEDGYEKARDVLDTEVLAPPSVAPATTSPAVTPVNHPVSVVMVVPAGGTRDSTTLADVVGAVNGPVADFWSQETDGTINFGVAAQKDWVNLAVGCDDPYALWDAAAKAVGFTRGEKKHLLVYVSSTPGNLTGCSDGLGEVGWSKDTGGYSYVRGAMPSIIAHELGHNLSLGHSSLQQCDGVVDVEPCEVTPYLDLYDVMGASWEQIGSLSLAQAALLIPIPQSQAFDPQSAPATVTLTPVSQRSGVRGIALRSDLWTQYWVEYRPPTGRDAWLGTSDNRFGLQSGVLIRKKGSAHDTSLLLDGSPSPEAGWVNDLDVAFPLNTPVRVDDLPGKNGAFFLTVTSLAPSGATVEVQPKSAITLRYEASGGASGPMGAPTAAESCSGTTWITDCSRSFDNGIITWHYGAPARLIHGEIYGAWVAGGGSGPLMGSPSEDPQCGLANGGCRQSFSNASIAWSPLTGAFAIRQAARFWYENGAEAGLLGYPTAAATCITGGCSQPFQGGTVVSRASGGAIGVRGPIYDLWTAAGGVAGSLGLPTSDLLTVPGGSAQVFDGGSVYWSAGTGAHAVSGPIRAVWWATGSITGPLGFPTGDHVVVAGGEAVSFTGGSIYSSASTGTRVLRGRLHDAFLTAGGVTGPLGFPVSDVLAVPGGSAVAFQGGSIYDSPGTGAHVVRGQIRSAWWATGGISGPLGFPTSDYAAVAAGFAASFQGGSIYESATTGARVVRGDVRWAWWSSGGVTGPLGFPTSDLLTVPGGTAQAFSGGSVYSSATSGAHALPSRLLAPWWATGGVTGPLGYPSSGVLAVPGGSAVAFQGGSVYDSPSTGAHAISGAIRSAWWTSGGVTGPLGFPASGLLAVPGGTAQVFSGGSMYSSPAGGARAVRTEFLAPWWATGGVTGPMGFPVSDLLNVPGGTAQAFAAGSVYAANGSPAYAVHGSTRNAWWGAGGLSGWLGFPTGNTTVTGSRSSTRFAGGLLATTSAGVLAASDPFMQAADRVGGTAVVGLPVGAESAIPGGRAQAFERASVYSSVATGTRVVSGPLRNAWWASGGVTGPYGYPTGDVVDVAPGEQSLAFATGTLYWSSTTGTRFVAT